METYIDKVVKRVEEETKLKSKQLVRYYSLLVLIKGEDVTLKDIHDGWSMNMNYRESNPPYCYGHDHRSIVPFNELSKETQDKDAKYLEALKKVAKELNQ
jgi:hypothetical protein